MILFPYFLFTYYEEFLMLKIDLTAFLAAGAVLTILGVPLGHMLNQIHHAITWVLPRMKNDGWRKYFEEEIKADKIFQENDYVRERYRYLLSKKHEVGSILVSFTISAIVILLVNVGYNNQGWAWFYFAVVLILSVIMFFSRLYTSGNIEYYFDDYLLEKSKNEVNAFQNDTNIERESEEELSLYYRKKN